jgi:hypothetical protein
VSSRILKNFLSNISSHAEAELGAREIVIAIILWPAMFC